jgi:hypothetical protein
MQTAKLNFNPQLTQMKHGTVHSAHTFIELNWIALVCKRQNLRNALLVFTTIPLRSSPLNLICHYIVIHGQYKLQGNLVK